ncbi:C39 family peptidase [Candidatus Woesebacteria bacterium]|nr:C39 family peptidase [Candidatus Woesebacteria bacterium]
MKKIGICILIFAIVILPLFYTSSLHAEDTNDDQQKAALEQQIKEYEAKLTEIRNEKNTLASQIEYMDTQIYITGLRIKETEDKITETEKEIDKLGTRIDDLDGSLSRLSETLLERIVAGYKNRQLSLFDIILDSNNSSTLMNKLKYYNVARDSNQKVLLQVQEAKLNYEEQKDVREKKVEELDVLSKDLVAQKANLADQQAAKERLLATTKNDEATYQSLLSEAKAQLAGFSGFAQSQGGATLLNNQTVCDDWGCYYNQRDSAWGSNSLNGTQYSLASDGCLVTSMAMIYTHYNHKSVNPQTINSDSWNFASYYPAYLNFTIRADGVISTRARSEINNELQNGKPVIVGIKYANGDTHFVVLVDYNGGNYLMNDPFTPNGHKIEFTSKYSLGSIYVVYKINGF